MNLAAGLDRLQQGVLVDLTVDGHGEALLEMGSEGGEPLRQPPEELLHAARIDLELGHAAGELAEVAGQYDADHGAPRPSSNSGRQNVSPCL
jgi:hypothetical protein